MTVVIRVNFNLMMIVLMMTLMCKKLRMPFLYCLNAKAQELLQLAFHMWKVNTYYHLITSLYHVGKTCIILSYHTF